MIFFFTIPGDFACRSYRSAMTIQLSPLSQISLGYQSVSTERCYVPRYCLIYRTGQVYHGCLAVALFCMSLPDSRSIMACQLSSARVNHEKVYFDDKLSLLRHVYV